MKRSTIEILAKKCSVDSCAAEYCILGEDMSCEEHWREYLESLEDIDEGS